VYGLATRQRAISFNIRVRVRVRVRDVEFVAIVRESWF
jgi:hypothetical protein